MYTFFYDLSFSLHSFPLKYTKINKHSENKFTKTNIVNVKPVPTERSIGAAAINMLGATIHLQTFDKATIEALLSGYESIKYVSHEFVAICDANVPVK